MRNIFPLLTALFARLRKRQDGLYNDGQYHTQIVEATSWTYSPSEIISYHSTEIITITSMIPCPITTSYTTIYKCSTCACDGCYPDDGGHDEPDDGGGGGGVVVGLVCDAKPCINQAGATSTTVYAPGESAIVVINGLAYQTPLSSCSAFTSPPFFEVVPTAGIPACGNEDNVVSNANGVTTVTYTYTTDGALIVVATTMGVVGDGPFHYPGTGNGNRLDGSYAMLFFWLWTTAAVIAGTGMIVL